MVREIFHEKSNDLIVKEDEKKMKVVVVVEDPTSRTYFFAICKHLSHSLWHCIYIAHHQTNPILRTLG